MSPLLCVFDRRNPPVRIDCCVRFFFGAGATSKLLDLAERMQMIDLDQCFLRHESCAGARRGLRADLGR